MIHVLGRIVLHDSFIVPQNGGLTIEVGKELRNNDIFSE